MKTEAFLYEQLVWGHPSLNLMKGCTYELTFEPFGYTYICLEARYEISGMWNEIVVASSLPSLSLSPPLHPSACVITYS